jgi:uncharacterized protein YjbI with pentapeptide repeats
MQPPLPSGQKFYRQNAIMASTIPCKNSKFPVGSVSSWKVCQSQFYSRLRDCAKSCLTLLYAFLRYSTLSFSTLRYSKLLYATLSFFTLHYSTLLSASLRFSTLLSASLRFSTLLSASLRYFYKKWGPTTPCLINLIFRNAMMLAQLKSNFSSQQGQIANYCSSSRNSSNFWI